MIEDENYEEMLFLSTLKSVDRDFITGKNNYKELSMLKALIRAHNFSKKRAEDGEKYYIEATREINRLIISFKNGCDKICFSREDNLNG